MKILGWITVLTILVVLCTALPSRIVIGGLFDAEDEELEHVFKIAVNDLNSNKLLLTDTRVLAFFERLSSENSFLATKMSCNLLQNGVAAIVGPQSELTSMHVQSICDNFEIPHIKSRWEYRLRRDQLSVNLYPHPSVLTKAFIRILDIWNWKEFFVVYEEDEAIIRMKDLLMEGEKKNWTIKMYKFPNAASYRDVFWDIKNSAKSGRKKEAFKHNIVLDVPREHLRKVMISAQQVGMMTEEEKYLITSLDLHTIKLEDFQYGNTNITGLRLVQEDTLEFQNLVKQVNSKLGPRRRNTTSPNTLKTEAALVYDSVKLLALGLEQMDAARHVSVFPPISCNLMNKGVDGTSLLNFMKNVKMNSPGLSGMIEFDAEGYRSKINLDIIFLTAHGLKKIGTIILPENHVNLTSPDSPGFESLKHEGKHFVVSTFLNDPYVMLRDSSQMMEGNDRYEGYGIDLLDALAEMLHFTYEIHPVKDEKYGRQDEISKQWDGMIGEVVNGTAHLAITDLTITADRMKGVDFTLPFMQTGIGIVFKRPTEKVTSLFSFLLPFSGEVWLLIVIAYAYISLCLFLVGRMSAYEWANPYPCRKTNMVEGNCFSLLNSMWWAIGSLLQQGSDVSPTASSTRALTSTWSFFRVIIISSYTANLAAFLTVEKLVTPFESAEDLVKQDKIKYGCVESGSTRNFFKNSNISTFQEMYKFMQKHASEVYVKTNIDGIEKVKKGNYAFMMEATTIEYNTERECNITQVGGLLDSKAYGIAVPKGNFDIRNWLSGGILQLQEDGKLHSFKEKWWKQKKGGGKCAAVKTSGVVNELGLGNVGGVILVMNLGIVLSAFVGFVEFFWFQRKLRRDPQESTCRLFWKQLKYAFTCGSSTKAAPRFKDKEREESVDTDNTGYRSFP